MARKYLLNILIAGTVLMPVTPANAIITSGVWLGIPDSALPYISRVRRGPHETYFIIYNPVLCEKISDACHFFIEHEAAHGFLRDVILPPEKYPESLERRADCWAAKMISSEAVMSAYHLFTDKNLLKDLPITGDPEKRAETIKSCAIEKGTWTG